MQVSTVVKSMPRNIGRLKTFRSSDFFRNECNFYKEVLPRMMQFQADRGISGANFLTEVPKCLAVHCDGENDFLALEDLRPGGYRPASRQNGLDLMHCQLIIKKLGKFHAISLAIKDQEPQLFVDMIKYVEVSVWINVWDVNVHGFKTIWFLQHTRKPTILGSSRTGITTLHSTRS